MILFGWFFDFAAIVNTHGFGLGFDVEYPHIESLPEDLADPEGARLNLPFPGAIEVQLGPITLKLTILKLEYKPEDKVPRG